MRPTGTRWRGRSSWTPPPACWRRSLSTIIISLTRKIRTTGPTAHGTKQRHQAHGQNDNAERNGRNRNDRRSKNRTAKAQAQEPTKAVKAIHPEQTAQAPKRRELPKKGAPFR